jgi:hypothetical protein
MFPKTVDASFLWWARNHLYHNDWIWRNLIISAYLTRLLWNSSVGAGAKASRLVPPPYTGKVFDPSYVCQKTAPHILGVWYGSSVEAIKSTNFLPTFCLDFHFLYSLGYIWRNIIVTLIYCCRIKYAH